MKQKKKSRKQLRAETRREKSEQTAARKRLAKECEARKAEEVAKAFKRNPARKRLANIRSGLEETIAMRAPKLLDARFHGVLKGLDQTHNWCRELQGWKPKGKSPNTQFKSLADHLLVQYPLPAFLYAAFEESNGNTRKKAVALFQWLGKGGSLYKAVQNKVIPTPLTKKMCHAFMQASVRLGFIAAVRHAQVTVHGGDRRLAEAICTTRQLGREFAECEDFWDTVIQWTCAQAMLAPCQIGPIYDWIAHRLTEDEAFSMKGRTALSVLRAVDAWHGELARQRKIQGHLYEAAGFAAFAYKHKVTLRSGGKHTEQHHIDEILSSKELAEEGRVMKHCVYSYSYSIQKGNCSIWSYSLDGERQLTIEVTNRSRQVVQVRGKFNARPTVRQLSFVQRWMKENNLVAGARF